MNNLEQYIGDLNPSVWVDAANVNGFDMSNPNLNDDVVTWKNLGSLGAAADFVKPNDLQVAFNADPTNLVYLTYPKFDVDSNGKNFLNCQLNGTSRVDCLYLPRGILTTTGTLVQIGKDSTIVSSYGGGNPHGTMNVHGRDVSYNWMWGVPYTSNPVNNTSYYAIGNYASHYGRKPDYLAQVRGCDYENKMWYGMVSTQHRIHVVGGAPLVPEYANSDCNLQNVIYDLNRVKLYDFCYDLFSQNSGYGVGGIYAPHVIVDGHASIYPHGLTYTYCYEVIFFPKLLEVVEMQQLVTYIKIKYNI